MRHRWVYGLVLGQKFFGPTLHEDVTYGYHAISIDKKRKIFPVSLWDEKRKFDEQTIERVWFPVVHSDVGGSYAETVLSDIALAWMLKNVEQQGLRLKGGWADELKLNPSGLIHESRAGFWRMCRPAVRSVPKGAKIHNSVVERMNGQTNYQPQNLPDNYNYTVVS